MTTRNDNSGKFHLEAERAEPGESSPRREAGPSARIPTRSSNSPGNLLFGYKFKDPKLLRLALTHSSLAYESNPDHISEPGSDNEQLEFIGDAVLGLVVAEALYRRFPASREGDLTRLRASLVSSRNLAQVATRLELGPMLRLGRGEEQSGGQRKPALLANALEAVIAGIYLDGGLESARDFVHQQIIQPVEADLASVMRSDEPFSGAVGDYKSALQERLQAAGVGQPKYIMIDQSGPDHRKNFRIEVRVSDGNGGSIKLGEAEGTTKKQAQQEAARQAMASLLAGKLTELLISQAEAVGSSISNGVAAVAEVLP